MNKNLNFRILPRHWGYLSLLIWGALTLFLIRPDAYNLDEGAAKSLLLTWSIADQVASSVVHLSAPDLRILLFLPAGFLWTGNVFAAKVFTALLFGLTTWLLYSWKSSKSDNEQALIATGLLIISPLTLAQIDSLAPGIYLLLAFSIGAWLDNAYREAPHAFGGWYFAQLFICALSVSLHPAGLAYPIALLWSWYKNPLDHKHQKYFFIGISFVVFTTLLIRMGWHDLSWFQNPISNLAKIVLGVSASNEMSIARWMTGSGILLILCIVVLKQFRVLWTDLTGRTLLIALVFGTVTCDPAWSLIAASIILYFGFPLVLRPLPSDAGGFFQHRGIALALLILLSTLFMLADKSHYLTWSRGQLSGQDQLIRTLSEAVESVRKSAEDSNNNSPLNHFRVASQWPGRTMIACKCDTFPLPPAAKDPQSQLNLQRSITDLLFDPRNPENILLARNLSALGGEVVETVELLPEGVLLHFKSTPPVRSGT